MRKTEYTLEARSLGSAPVYWAILAWTEKYFRPRTATGNLPLEQGITTTAGETLKINGQEKLRYQYVQGVQPETRRKQRHDFRAGIDSPRPSEPQVYHSIPRRTCFIRRHVNGLIRPNKRILSEFICRSNHKNGREVLRG
ncbi:unnamed protein product [Nesidiocoris tenuis]|uniref:Uncharacterized protein n=1 Tax=Nesidiocoris tenuis TaxID=355587 RepID=A0A6H5GC62_9HEMI|nr:unnamed protein product [Nesidiocoris tenuis]